MGYLSCKAQSSSPTIDSQISPSIHEFTFESLQLATSNFSPSNLLGRGSHGLVYKGVLPNGTLVAIKRPFPGISNSIEFDNEIGILSRVKSPKLVNLLGFTKNGLLVVEFMSNGSLYDALHRVNAKRNHFPNWSRRIRMALQIAKAVDTLHCLNPPVVHRDIKSANVLIDMNLNARLGDFGLALTCVDDIDNCKFPPAGTMGYLDPCYVNSDHLSTKIDVFSFGILLLEMISGRKAIDVLYSPPSIVNWAIPLIKKGKFLSIFDSRIVPPKNAVVRKMLAVLAVKCVRSCRERRPSMKEVVVCLSEVNRLVSVRYWNGLGNPCLMVESSVVKRETVRSRSSVKVDLDSGFGNGKDGVSWPADGNPRCVAKDVMKMETSLS